MSITFYRGPNRALTAWKPVYHRVSLMDDIDQLAGDFWSSWRPEFLNNTMIPHTDTYEEEDKLVISTELPGITEEDLEVMVDGNMLTIKAEKKEEVAEDATAHTQERYYGKYIRSVSLPFHVNGEEVSAILKNGVLEIRVPKTEETKPKKIEVKAQLPETKGKKRQRKSTKKSS
ncbi:Hsp20/alpha crystallin family protein [Chloroflexota bacterium]